MNAQTGAGPTFAPQRWQLEFVDRAGRLLADATGMPPSHIQLLAWLIVCSPPHQSVDDLHAALGLSPGAISMATGALVRMGAVEKVTPAADRRSYYRIGPGLWEGMVRARVEATAKMRRTVEEALTQATGRQERLEEMRDIYAWFESSAATFIAQHWPAERPARSKA